jgi:hypothetical protein
MAELTLSISLPYEPPRIERVLTAADLAREIEFAGKVVTLHT